MSNPDTIALCVSDLLHSDRVDSPAQMRDCIRAVCARLEALAPTEAAAMAATVPDPSLMKFYAVSTTAELIAAQAAHIERLQAKLPQAPSFAHQRAWEG